MVSNKAVFLPLPFSEFFWPFFCTTSSIKLLVIYLSEPDLMANFSIWQDSDQKPKQLFADDAAIIAHSGETLQSLINNLDRVCDVFSLSINVNKTVVLSQGPSSTSNISLKNCSLRTVESFNYLGSTITSTFSLEEEINIRLGKASTTFGRQSKRVWKNAKLT
jgi:hypothetical protein